MTNEIRNKRAQLLNEKNNSKRPDNDEGYLSKGLVIEMLPHLKNE